MGVRGLRWDCREPRVSVSKSRDRGDLRESGESCVVCVLVILSVKNVCVCVKSVKNLILRGTLFEETTPL